MRDDESPDYDEDFDFGDDEYETIDCPHCGSAIYEDAPACPHCGNYLTDSDRVGRTQPLWVILTAIFLLMIFVYALVRPFLGLV